jgi:hypothetical protein
MRVRGHCTGVKNVTFGPSINLNQAKILADLASAELA